MEAHVKLEQTRAKLEEVRARSFNWRTKLEAPLPARAPAPGVSAASFKVRKGHAASNSEEFTEAQLLPKMCATR